MYTRDVLEMETTAAVDAAVQAFAQALADSAVFKRFEQASGRLQADPAAQQAKIAYQQKQQSSRALLMLNALSPAERQELEQLRQAFFGQRAVVAVIQAQADLSYLRALQDELRVDAVIMDYIQAQEDALNYLPQVNQAISEWLGIDFAALSAGSG